MTSHHFACWPLLFGFSSALFAQPAVDFEREVAPLIAKRCLECHNAKDAQGGLNLTTITGLRQGGDSGRAFEAGKPQSSLLLRRVIDGEMPPESRGQSQKLPDAEIAVLQRWIEAGAPWPKGRKLDLYERTTDVRAGLDWWSLQPVQRPQPPGVPNAANPIDAFVLQRLQKANMQPAPPADRRTLIRRAYFDLLGLPPTPEQIDAFLQDDSPNAYEKLLDQLLESQHYGERWARHWLDLVRFAETCGYERDHLKPNIWRYRDWVIDAFNNDIPYDRFVTDQLAGDEAPHRDEQSVIATGMLRAGTWNDEPNDPADYLYTRLEDMVHTTSSAFLGLTVKCARCHNHKFDPIRQTDYYRIASFFWAGYMGQANQGGPSKEQLGFDVYGWTDKAAKVEPIRLLIKGERGQPGAITPPGFLSAIPALDQPLQSPPPQAKTTHRRLQFAGWITDPRNPLTARVFVNRLWLHHFGDGIVRTPNNFGFKSDPPTHPQLLDWLAAEFVAGGWKIKRMHKLIMMSNTYRQSSLHPRGGEYAQRDFLNRNWWRFNRRRLDAESLRDALLHVSGRLNPQRGGPSFYPQMSPEALEGLSRKSGAWGNSSLQQRNRRSIYMIVKRSRLLPLMTTFDFGDTTLPCGKRDSTTVPSQALAMMNNHFVHEQSDALARRIARKTDDQGQQIERLWRLTLGRPPQADETQAATEHLQTQLAHFHAQQKQAPANTPAGKELSVRRELTLWLRADRGVETDAQGKVMFWQDGSPTSGAWPRDASQSRPDRRPQWVEKAIGGKPALRFDGKRQYLHVAGRVIHSQQFSIFAVANHLATDGGPREIISNWNRRGRSTTSVFLGAKGRTGVRLSDAFAQAGPLQEPTKPFILSGISGAEAAWTFQNDRLMASQKKLSKRDLGGPYVVGTQGDYNHEWWHGDIAEILVYDRALGETERQAVWKYLADRYRLPLKKQQSTPEHLALASLCHVLLNANEFMYVD